MRNEKKLLAIPWPTCPNIEQLHLASTAGEDWLFNRYRAETVEISGEKYLGVTVFTKKGKPRCRFWQGDGQNGVQFYEAEQYGYCCGWAPGRMYSACIDSIYSIGRNWGTEDIFYAEAGDKARAQAFVGTDKEPIRELALQQKKKREQNNLCRDEKKRLSIKERLQYTEPPGEDFMQWAIDVPLKEHRYWLFEPGQLKRKTE